ncbi:hypothetical protein [Streptomyces sp. NPDC051567]|uniref:hypothetical protein n=1 Tax=Streptomyces sp. NPDC051567 TaxID=3365660 RepID=UPI003790B0EC
MDALALNGAFYIGGIVSGRGEWAEPLDDHWMEHGMNRYRSRCPRAAIWAMVLVACTGAVAAAPAPAARAEGTVDLALDVTNVVIAPGGTGQQEFTVSNLGTRATKAASRLIYVTPVYINFASVPSGCVRRLENPDPLVPQIAECTVPAGLEPGETFTVIFNLSATPTNLAGTSYGDAIVSPDITVDPESNFSDNVNVPDAGIRQPKPPAVTGRVSNVYLAFTTPALAPGKTTLKQFTIGNEGPSATVDPVRLVFATPFFVNFADVPLPLGCTLLLDDNDPLIPQVVECRRTLPLPAGLEQVYDLALTAVRGGPSGMVCGPAVASESKPGYSSTQDPSVIDNVLNSCVNELP